MLRQITAFLALSLALAGCAAHKHSEDCSALKGEWVIVAAKENGKPVSPERLKQLASRRHTVGDDRITPCCLCPNCNGTATIEVDSTVSPKQMTLRCPGGGCCANGHVQKGIYSLDDDTFVFSRNNDASLPKDAASAPDSCTYKRPQNVAATAPATCVCENAAGCADCPACMNAAEGEKCEKCNAAKPAEKPNAPAPFPMQNPADDTQKAEGCEKGKRYAVPTNAWSNGVLTVFFPNVALADVDAAAKKAISRAKDDSEKDASVKINTAEGTGIFGHGPDGTPCNCTLSPADKFIIVRIHSGDWGDAGKSREIADKIAENL